MRRNLDRRIETLIKAAEQKARRQAKRRERERRRAILAAVEGASRELASRIKQSLKRQDHCPYCAAPLGDEPHADHIYPLSKGGLSVEANLVLVCSSCNGRKGSMTLTQFIQRHGLDREAIELRLRALRKVF
jgi:5-methylcytosine-specific restriction endonuclease McrA